MRFLLNDNEILELTFSLVFASITLGTQGVNEKDKMRSSLKTIMEKYFGFASETFLRLKQVGEKICLKALDEGQIDQFC
jgi:hypothetical protein